MKAFFKVLAGSLVVAFFALAGLFGTEYFLSSRSDAAQNRQGQSQAVRVGLATPQERQIADAVRGVGTLMAIRTVDMVPSASGRVTQVPVVSVQEVSAGDLIVQMDDRAERAALNDANATLEEARQDLRRFEELAESNTTAEARLEQARARFQRAEAAVMRAEAELDDRRLVAPFDGTIGLIDVEPGAFLSGDTPVTRLSDLSVMEVEVGLPERYYDQVAPGQPVEITTPAFASRTFSGSVTARAPQIDLNTRSFVVRAEIDNSDGKLVGGMFADARVILGESEGLAIPDDAIISEGLTSYVFTVVDGTARRTEITPGVSVGELTAVSGSLAKDDRVVVAGWDNLSDGAAVEIDESFDQGAAE
ncbi:efflux RND transporter periplasmic adaptor subunit [Sulfitobacter sp. HNIBRBA3233]|uniref:efflux RND transporter periplasmic adaptor subunit n=1 Tax=Sulfitobacter marinivivus TaxID=3158558 RepID=UPI0032DFEFB5